MNNTKIVTEIANQLAVLRASVEAIEIQAKELESVLGRIRSVKGTREVEITPPAKPIDPSRPYFVGDDCTKDQIFDAVERCISDRPRLLREIVELLGMTNRTRVSNTIVKLKVQGRDVQNMGDGKTALWYIPKTRIKR